MKIGDKVPDMLGTDQNGAEVRLGDFMGGKTKRAMLSEPDWAGSADGSVS